MLNLRSKQKITPSAFPYPKRRSKYIFPYAFGDDGTADNLSLAKADFETLYENGCIEVENAKLPEPDLANAIHPLFSMHQFNWGSAEDNNRKVEYYKFLEPAIKLASRFLTEDNYLDFWVLLANSRYKFFEHRAEEKLRIYELEPDTSVDKQIIRAQVKAQMMQQLPKAVKFFFNPEGWGANDVDGEHVNGQTFFDDVCHDHFKRENAKGKCDKGECVSCDEEALGLCYCCRSYAWDEFDESELQGMIRKFPNHGFDPVGDLSQEECMDRLKKIVTQDRGMEEHFTFDEVPDHSIALENMRIGLNNGILVHLREATGAEPRQWTKTEELRFQFSVAITLCHELVHAYWPWSNGHCSSCYQDPWTPFDQNEHEYRNNTPEIGKSWESWALGYLGPSGIQLAAENYIDGAKDNLGLFERTTMNFINCNSKTNMSHFAAVAFVFPLTVEHISSWFMEETWKNIAKKGRERGRPQLDDLKAMSIKLVKYAVEGENGTHEGKPQNYTYRDVIRRGGFASMKQTDIEYLYQHVNIHSIADESKHHKRLENARNNKKRKRSCPKSGTASGRAHETKKNNKRRRKY